MLRGMRVIGLHEKYQRHVRDFRYIGDEGYDKCSQFQEVITDGGTDNAEYRDAIASKNSLMKLSIQTKCVKMN